ncbi:GNAT family N-acetyltransferase [Glycomyces sp. NPDC046736]|uniref:GNAT family N-acetyltransferase n=1 Tax=Glycomyces sp. NPDC046736 TaxID=3155615 RepID=UPI0033F77652
MVNARHAELGDIDEIIRLREVMIAEWFDMSDSTWKSEAAEVLRRRLDEPKPTMAVTVIDAPDGAGLAACAAGTIEERLPFPVNLSGRVGWVFNVVTDPQWRRRGFSRSCVTALLDWFDQQSVATVELLATGDGEGLYQRYGFNRTKEPSMRLRMTERTEP